MKEAACLALTVNVVILLFLLAQPRLLREQVVQVKHAFVHEQRKSPEQSTLKFLGATMEQLHSLCNQLTYRADRPARDRPNRS